MHKELCGLLLAAYEALDRTVKMLAEFAPILSKGRKVNADSSFDSVSSSTTGKKEMNGSPIDSLAKLRKLNSRLTVSGFLNIF